MGMCAVMITADCPSPCFHLGIATLTVHLSTKWRALQSWIAETYLARHVAEIIFRARSRVQLERLDRQVAARCQANGLLGLVHRAQNTSFGIKHDFRRIRSEEDFRRLVPVTSNAALARNYWQRHDTALGGSTWPNPVAGLGTYDTGERTCQVLLSPDFFRTRQAALETALALVSRAHPITPLLSGALLFLGGPVSVAPPINCKSAITPETALQSSLPLLYRPYCMGAVEAPLRQKTGSLQALEVLAEKCVRLPLTLACGPLTELTRLFDQVKKLANRDRIADLWPGLMAVLYSSRTTERGRVEELRQHLGPKVSLLEMACFPEGLVAVEDPRHDLLRLLADDGVYCEFIPTEESGKRSPQRVGLSQAQTGIPYEMALTSPAGVWACRVGAAICFERLDPPLFRFVEMPRVEPVAGKREVTSIARQDPATGGLKAPALHRQNGGNPAEPPESYGHNPWLVRVDRG
jgi:hypothetical protein